MWRLPPANIEGAHASPERTLQTTPLATTVRPYAPGDSMNRIHWRTTARFGEIQVKEFDLEQTADAWIFLDLEAAAGRRAIGPRPRSPCAWPRRFPTRRSAEPRGRPDRQRPPTTVPPPTACPPAAKILQLLAAVESDGRAPFAEALVNGLTRLRRGMTAIVITASQDPSFIRPLAVLRSRGISAVVVLLDGPAFEPPPENPAEAEAHRQRSRALRHALAEYELPTYVVGPDRDLAEALAR
jgi:uncharacterized protein (DUF58 family)